VELFITVDIVGTTVLLIIPTLILPTCGHLHWMMFHSRYMKISRLVPLILMSLTEAEDRSMKEH